MVVKSLICVAVSKEKRNETTEPAQGLFKLFAGCRGWKEMTEVIEN